MTNVRHASGAGTRRVITALLAAFLAWPALAQEDALKTFPGYVDFGALSQTFGEPTVQIAVGESLLNLVSALGASEDPQAAQLLKRLKGVRINVFETSALAEEAVSFVRDASTRLGSQGWEPVVTVNSPSEQVRIFMKISGELIEGITVMAVEESEAVFINVIGSLSPAELEQVMDNFDIDFDAGGAAAEEGAAAE